MGSLLKSTLNTRALPVESMRYIRSDAPLCLTEEEIWWLLDNDISTLVDLRSAQELERTPCPLQNVAGFTYYHLPVTGGGDIPKSREHLHEVYRGMVDEQMDTILGVVSALLLRRLEVSEDVIVEDYMKSKENLLDMLTAYAKNYPEVDIDIVIPQEENIRKVLSAGGNTMKEGEGRYAERR